MGKDKVGENTMKCPDCGREIVEVPLSLSEEELLNIQYALDKRATGNMAMSSDVIKGMTFDTDAQRISYIKACLDEVAEGNFLYNAAIFKLKERYLKEENSLPVDFSDIVISEGKLYRHVN